MSFRTAVVLLLLVCAVNAATKSKNYSVRLNKNFEGKTLTDPRVESSALVFGYCHEGVCTFFYEKDTNLGTREHLHSCNFYFEKGEVLELYPFGPDKIIFMYEVNENKRFEILHLRTCKPSSVMINDDEQIMDARVMDYDDSSFDVSVNNFGQGSKCQERTCKMTINEYGSVNKGLKEWVENADYRSVAISQSQGYIVIVTNVTGRYADMHTVSEDGTTRLLEHFPTNQIPPVSTKYQFVTTCGVTKSNMTCVQYNKNGHSTIQMSLMYKNVKQAKLHNLPDGGFMLLTSKCPKTVGRCYVPISHFTATKISPNGKIEGFIEVTDFSAPLYFELNSVHFFMNSEEELCFSKVNMPYLRKLDEQVVEVFCYNKRDFIL